jgi:F-type H+-transporting ATPase subunit epsilon
MGVLTQHTPLSAQLGIGELCVKAAGASETKDAVFAVRGGFVQVLDDQVILLATDALNPDDIAVAALKSELEEILEKLQHPESDEQYQELLDDRRWIETRQKVAG